MKNTLVKEKEKTRTNEEFRFLLTHILSIACAFALSQCVLFKNSAPFGISFVAALPPSYLGTGALGAILGYFVSGVSPIRYVCAIFITAIIRYSLGSYRSLSSRTLFAPLSAVISALSTSLAAVLSVNAGLADIATSISEALFAGAGAYFFNRAIRIKPQADVSGFGCGELSCAVVFACLVFSGLSKLEIYSVSPARALGLFLIMFFAKAGGEAYGSVAGLLAGFAFVLGGAPYEAAAAYAAGGLIGGVFSRFSHFTSAIAFALSSGVAIVSLSSGTIEYGYLIEILAASVLFAIFPRSLYEKMRNLLFPSLKKSIHSGESRTVAVKLSEASKAICNASETAKDLPAIILQNTADNANEIRDRIFTECCSSCGLHNFCWEQNFSDSRKDLDIMCDFADKKGKITKDDAPESFLERCIKSDEYIKNMSAKFSDCKEIESAKRRANEISSRIKDEFSLAAAILSDVSSDYVNEYTSDEKLETKIRAVMNSYGIFPQKAVCSSDSAGRLNIEITAPYPKGNFDRYSLTETLSEACKRSFSLPKTQIKGDETAMLFYEKPAYRIRCAVYSRPGDSSAISGDAGLVYDLGSDKKVMMISDGMGSGGAAAVNSNMAVNIISGLTQAGVGFYRAIEIANEALTGDGDSEALTTVDCAVADIFSGEVEFLKAGAARSFVRRGRLSVPVECISLPIGILSEVKIARTKLRLAGGDLVVIVSDGAVCGDTKWILDEMNEFENTDAGDLAKRIGDLACEKCTDAHRDDITVIAAVLDKNGQ